MKNTKSRKNSKSLIVVAMLLMVTLVLGMGAMTYSKYVSEQDVPTQQATAAKWGYVITVNADNMLGAKYEDGIVADAGDDVVSASISNAVVAPGTGGSMTITVTGASEVRAKMTITVAGGSTDIYLNDYYPIKWTLTEKVGDGAATTLVNGLKLSDVVTALNGKTATMEAGTASVTRVYTLSWSWAMGDGSTDNQDTFIGFLANGGKTVAQINQILGTSYADDVANSTALNLDITVKVEQIAD